MLKIHRWNETFETAKTRKLVHLNWLHCPAGVDSSGYIELMTRGEDGVKAFGVFLAICQWSATCPPQIRGKLARTDGKPLQVRQIASVIRMPISVVENAIAILIEDSVGWLITDEVENIGVVPDAATNPPLICQPPATNPPLVPVQGEEGRGEGEDISAAASLAKASNKELHESIRIAFDDALQTKSRITSKRVAQLNARLRDPWWKENWQSAIARAAESDFLRGKNDRGWRADLEWFCKPDSANAILEGKYDNRDGEMGEFLRVLTTCLTQPDAAERRKLLGAELHEACKRTDIEVIRQARDGRMLKNISAIFYQNLKDVRNSRQQSQIT